MFLRQRPLSQNVTTNSTTEVTVWCSDSKEGSITWATFNLLNVLLGFPACIAAMWELFKAHRRNGTNNPFTPNDVFMLNIAAMDFILFVSLLPDVVNFLLEYSPTLLAVVLVPETVSLCGRPLLMACICVDCYLAVVHPLVYRARKSLVPRVVAVAVVWLAAVANAVLALIFHTYDNALVLVWPHIISLPTIAFCDVSILRALRRSDPGGRGGRDPLNNPQKKKAHQIIVNSLVMTAVVYLPTVVLPLLSLLLNMSEHVFMCQVILPGLILPNFGSTLMPILYLENLGKLDRLKARVMTWWLGKRAS